MLGDSGTTGTKVCGDLTDGQPIVAQESKDLSASGISDGAENCVLSLGFSGNHVVTDMVTERLRMSMLKGTERVWLDRMDSVDRIDAIGVSTLSTGSILSTLSTRTLSAPRAFSRYQGRPTSVPSSLVSTPLRRDPLALERGSQKLP